MICIPHDYELMNPQVHKNVAIVPIKTPANHSIDLLTLQKGFELDLVKVKECEHSTVNTIIVENTSVVPLILVDGEEIVGGDQNRIMDATILIGPESKMKVPVNCTEHGRWGFKHHFKQSENIANYRTRLAKRQAFQNSTSVQQAVWNAIDELEIDRSFSSPTQAMSESYEDAKADLNEFLDAFKTVDGQSGVVVLIDGKIMGFEVFLNSDIYRQYHEKILKSYLIDAKISDNVFTINTDAIESLIREVENCEFEESQTTGLENRFEFKNDDGVGTLYTYHGKTVHLSYLTGSGDVENGAENPIHDDVRI